MRQQWEPTTEEVRLSYTLPEAKPQDPARQIQGHGGIRLSVTAPTFEARLDPRATYEALSPATSESNVRVFMKRETPRVAVSPGQLSFRVRITNQHEHVLRMAGTVVSVNVNGTMQSLSRENYGELLDGMVLPRQEAEFTIRGPRVETLPDGALIGLFLYDVVTRTDAAGNPTERRNFEWYFNYNVEERSRTAEAVTQRVRLERAEAARVGAPWPIERPAPARR